MLLSQKFLTRPYHRNDLFKLRVLFVWLIQNIRPEYHQNRQHDLRLLKMKEQQQQKPVLPTPSKSSNLRQRLGLDSSIPDIQYQQQQQQQFIDQINLNSINLLQEESHIITSILEEEDAADVLESRSCRSAVGMANLFYEMAIAAGIQDCRVVYGHLKAPKDGQEVEPNHAWCSGKNNI
jgi:hypothetical protein